MSKRRRHTEELRSTTTTTRLALLPVSLCGASQNYHRGHTPSLKSRSEQSDHSSGECCCYDLAIFTVVAFKQPITRNESGCGLLAASCLVFQVYRTVCSHHSVTWGASKQRKLVPARALRCMHKTAVDGHVTSRHVLRGHAARPLSGPPS